MNDRPGQSQRSLDGRARAIMSGEARGLAAGGARVALAAAEPIYSAAVRWRNRLFDRGSLRPTRVDRPVISVGNLTTGGTGKTPAVQYLARAFQRAGLRPGILMRGYQRESPDAASDEEQLLRDSLPGVPVRADPDRAATAAALLAEMPLDVLLLDDGFQHRRLHRDLDLVLIDATEPFGYGHVLPRGMLREPIAGLSRAHLVIITRADAVDTQRLASIEATIREHARDAPIVRSTHRLGDALDVEGRSQPLAGRRVLAFSGIGNPMAFERSLADAGATLVGSRRFADHYPYRESDVVALRVAAIEAAAEALVTTEKDWVKVRTLTADAPGTAIWRVPVELRLSIEDEATLRRTIADRTGLSIATG